MNATQHIQAIAERQLRAQPSMIIHSLTSSSDDSFVVVYQYKSRPTYYVNKIVFTEAQEYIWGYVSASEDLDKAILDAFYAVIRS